MSGFVDDLENLEIIWPHKLRFQITFTKTQCFPSWCFFRYVRNTSLFLGCSVELSMEQDLQQWPLQGRALWEAGGWNTFLDLPDCSLSSTGCAPWAEHGYSGDRSAKIFAIQLAGWIALLGSTVFHIKKPTACRGIIPLGIPSTVGP